MKDILVESQKKTALRIISERILKLWDVFFTLGGGQYKASVSPLFWISLFLLLWLYYVLSPELPSIAQVLWE